MDKITLLTHGRGGLKVEDVAQSNSTYPFLKLWIQFPHTDHTPPYKKRDFFLETPSHNRALEL